MLAFFTGIMFVVAGIATLLAICMTIYSGKQQALADNLMKLVDELCRYALDSRWKESRVNDRIQWLASGAIRLQRPAVMGLRERLPTDKKLVVGPRVDDFWRWQHQEREREKQEQRSSLPAVTEVPRPRLN